MSIVVPQSQYNEIIPTLYLALELSDKGWKLGFTTGLGQKLRYRGVPAGDVQGLAREIGKAKTRFDLPPSTRVVSCYEAGGEAFWVHRWLTDQGVENLVVDSSSIEVNRKARRAKTDRLDLQQLSRLLIRHDMGEKKVWKVVQVPSEKDEDERHLQRELKTLIRSRTEQNSRVRGLLKTQGVYLKGSLHKLLGDGLDQLQKWNAQPLGEGLKLRVRTELQRLEGIEAQIEQLKERRKKELEERREQDDKYKMISDLNRFKGIGIDTAWTYVMESLGWKKFSNRRQAGGSTGLAGTPYQSGGCTREQGISKEGSVWIREVAIEQAWNWTRWQPHSDITRWFERRFGEAGKRARKRGIVAVARKVFILLWRFLSFGEIPSGVIFDGKLH